MFIKYRSSNDKPASLGSLSAGPRSKSTSQWLYSHSCFFYGSKISLSDGSIHHGLEAWFIAGKRVRIGSRFSTKTSMRFPICGRITIDTIHNLLSQCSNRKGPRASGIDLVDEQDLSSTRSLVQSAFGRSCQSTLVCLRQATACPQSIARRQSMTSSYRFPVFDLLDHLFVQQLRKFARQASYTLPEKFHIWQGYKDFNRLLKD